MLLSFALGALTMFLFILAMDVRYLRRLKEQDLTKVVHLDNIGK